MNKEKSIIKLSNIDSNVKSISRKEFKPTIPVRRKKSNNDVTEFQEPPTLKNDKPSKAKPQRGPRPKKEVVRASSGLFGGYSNKVPDPTVDAFSAVRTAADLEEEKYVDPFHQSSNTLTPVTLPINPRIDSKSTLSVGKEEDNTKEKLEKDDISAAELLYRQDNDDSESMLVFHFPDILPVAMGKLNLDPDEYKVDANTTPTIQTLPDGYLGRLRLHQSGKVTLMIGEVPFEVDIHSKSGFLQELLCCQTDSLDKGIIGNIGNVPYTLTVSPDYEALTYASTDVPRLESESQEPMEL